METLCPDIVWMCNVCSQPTKDIFVLPCQHKFCERCLTVWVGVYTDTYRPGHQEFPCRVCWQMNYLPRDGLQAYHRNYDICQLELTLGGLNMVTAQQQQNNTISQQHTNTNNPFYIENSIPVNNSSNIFGLQNQTAESNQEMSDTAAPQQQQFQQSTPTHHQQSCYDCDGSSPQREVNHFVGEQLKMSTSAPEFHPTPNPHLQNGVTNGNEMELMVDHISAQDVVCHLQEAGGGGFRSIADNIPIADCDRMIKPRLCYPNTCHMSHTDNSIMNF